MPPGRRLYCIGDIHGRLDLLDDVLGRVTTDLAARPNQNISFVFLGDYIDRGGSSAGVIERLATLSSIVPTVFLKGNHEAILVEFLWQPLVLPFWKSMGGYPTLMSWGVLPPLQPSEKECHAVAEALQAALTERQRAFFESLQSSYTEGDYLFVHAGIRPGRPLAEQDEHDLLWIREPFLEWPRRHESFVVHGHTPVTEPDVRGNRMNIDTGAYATGRLACLVLEDQRHRFI